LRQITLQARWVQVDEKTVIFSGALIFAQTKPRWEERATRL